MYARSTTVQAHLDSIDNGIVYIRDAVMPTMMDMPGCVGLSMLVDRETGRCIATSAWDTAESMRASEDMARPMREQAAEILGNRAQVDEWEIVVLHRDHPSHQGACVRATWVRFDAETLDRAIDLYRMAMLPAMRELEGFCSASLMIDREGGIAVSSVTYDDSAAMERTRDAADSLRLSGARDAGVEVLDVCEFELVLAHLHVPEMA